MSTLTQHLSPVQNLGLNDRIIRGVITALMVGLPFLDLANGGFFSWHGYVILLGIYPALTSVLGWDPVYSLFQVRSCAGAQCGTLPYEVAAAMGHTPVVDKDHEFDHSLAAAAADQHGTYRRDAMTPKKEKTQNRLLILATVILTLAVIAYLFWLRK